MINYYYEIKEDVTVFGQDIKYLSITDLKPSTVGWRHLHEEATNNSRRVWLENANGVTLVKEPGYNHAFKEVDDMEFTWIKLKARKFE